MSLKWTWLRTSHASKFSVYATITYTLILEHLITFFHPKGPGSGKLGCFNYDGISPQMGNDCISKFSDDISKFYKYNVFSNQNNCNSLVSF